jgi:DNA-binding CsgD family transcriptional regulator
MDSNLTHQKIHMKQDIIQPISPEEFERKIKTEGVVEEIDFLSFFEPIIQNVSNYAIGPYFWFIPDNTNMKIVGASPNVWQLTPYTQDEWLFEGNTIDFFANIIHPEDRFYILSAIQIAMQTSSTFRTEGREQPKFNIYGRMIDAHKNYRLMLIQFPNLHYGLDNQIDSALVLITDLSHLNISFNQMMTIIDNSSTKNQYFKVVVESKKLIPLNLPKITSREQEILRLMAKGMNTPMIVEELKIAYDTVENHKRNLREKTNTKTAAELMNFVWANNLI